MSHSFKLPRKLIEVSLPLYAINEACVKEKSPFLKGHPRAVHLWWARRPLAAARAVLFAQLVNDPGYQQGGGFKYGKNKKEAEVERKRLFEIIEDLVKWENIDDEEVLERARVEIRRSWREVCELNKDHPEADIFFDPDKMPGFHDPFAGGGAIPLEAKRLGLSTLASDLNPVAVIINKVLIEIPSKFAGCSPVGPIGSRNKGKLAINHDWKGLKGIAEDVRRYAAWIRREAENRIGHLYPSVKVTNEVADGRPDLEPLIGKELSVLAWLWTRTVNSPNPAFSKIPVPLASTFVLSKKKGKEAYLEPVIEENSYFFSVKAGRPTEKALDGTKVSRGANFSCLVSGVAIEPSYIKEQGKAGLLGSKLMAVVANGPKGRVYLPGSAETEKIAKKAESNWKPKEALPNDPRNFWTLNYGLETYGELFTERQLATLTLFTDLVQEVEIKAKRDAVSAGFSDDDVCLRDGGKGAKAYAEAIKVLVSCGVSQLLRYSCTGCSWNRTNENIVQAFGRQSFPMVWDFAEANPLVGSLSIETVIGWVASSLERLPAEPEGLATMAAAQTQDLSERKLVSTDPPYYDNITYADLSDFFYVWLRKCVQSVYPELFATMLVPKKEELVANRYRHKSKESAEQFFLDGMTEVMHRLAEQAHPSGPITIYYAFKQSDLNENLDSSSTGWETFLSAVFKAGFQVSGTWPMRTEKIDALKRKTNSLASSVVLVCRKRPATAKSISRRQYLRELNSVLPIALDEMTKGTGAKRSTVAPVDLSQAIIGPGIAVFSKYSAVLEADGSEMSVRTALQLINRFLSEEDFDRDTQFCLHWFEEYGWESGPFGEAETLSRAKGTSVDGVKDAGVVESGSGKVRLLKWAEYPVDWDPKTDRRNPIWETLHHLVRVLKSEGESSAGQVLAGTQGQAESVRLLAYRLYTLCDREGLSDDARGYNELITSWNAIESAAGAEPIMVEQLSLFE